MYPSCFNDLIECFKKFSGVGQKSAERMAFSILSDFDVEEVSLFCDSLSSVKSDIKSCSICGCMTDSDLCFVCSDVTRDIDSLVVVESSKDVFLLEKMGNFNGCYHVLNGLISPLDDIGPSDINLNSLIDRVKSSNIREIIFVLKSGIEADTTVLYVKKVLSDTPVVVSKIANGIPVGADMDYIDSLTLLSAFSNRKEVLD